MPEKLTPLWKVPCTARGLGGVAATAKHVIVSDRDLADLTDVFRCHAADTGAELWVFRNPAPGKLDYGNTSRATPVIVGDRVVLFGAFGHLHVVELATGKALWQKDLKAAFGPPAREMPWGLCGTPLVADGKVIVAPGTPDVALVAFDLNTGKDLWKTPGGPPGYGSFVVADLGGARQIVGHDADSLGGWDLATGKRLWSVRPKKEGDYNVPTPMVWNGHLIITTENNGTRLFRFGADGQIVPEPVAINLDLNPDTHSPVVVGDRLFGVSRDLWCLDLKAGLKPRWKVEDAAFQEYAALVATENRLLLFSQEGELLLLDVAGEQLKIVSRAQPLEGDKDLYAHPALAGTRLFLRGNECLAAFELSPPTRAVLKSRQ